MDKLSHECLSLIFEFLSIKDRIKVEGVCKRWKDVSRHPWCSFKRLDLKSATWVPTYGQVLLVDKKKFDQVIRLSGQYLTSIILNTGHREEYISQKLERHDVLMTISQSCPNIQELDLMAITCTSEHKIVPLLKPLSSQLITLRLNMKNISDSTDDLVELFGTMKNLRNVCLSDFLENTEYGKYLIELPLENLQEIGFSNGYISTEHLGEFLSIIDKCTGQLHTMHFDQIIIRSLERFIDTLSCKLTLKNLTLRILVDRNFNCHEQYDGTAWFISKMAHLETLDVENCCLVNDAFLKLIAQSCKHLKELNLSRTNISDRGISILSKMQGLRSLNLSFAGYHLKSPMLEKIPNLEELNCFGCCSLECSSLCDFVLKATRLRLLDVSYCPLVTRKLITAATEALKMRDDNRVLILVANRTKIEKESLHGKPALLNVIC